MHVQARSPVRFVGEPYFDIDDLQTEQRLILILPNCGVGFFDEDTPSGRDNIAEDFFTAWPIIYDRASAVFGVMNTRGGVTVKYAEFARLFTEKSFEDHPTALHASHAAIDEFPDSEGNPHIRTILNLGWPGVQYRANMSYVGVEVEPPEVARPALLGSRPNPFNPTATITYTLPGRTSVTLEIYAPSGRRVRTLADRKVQWAGVHEIEWDGRDDRGREVSSGVYLARSRFHHQGRYETSSKKIVLVR